MRHLGWILLGVTACVSEASQRPSATTTGSGAGSGLVCTEEKPVGTNISRTVCRTPDEIDDERKSADDMMRNQPSRPMMER